MELLDPFSNTAVEPVSTPTVTGFYDALHDAEQQAATLRTQNPAMSLPGHVYQIGRLYLTVGDGANAVRVLSESHADQAESGEQPPPIIPHSILTDSIRVSLGQAFQLVGQYAEARETLKTVLASTARDSRHYAVALLTLGLIERDHDAFDVASAHFSEAASRFEFEKMPYYAINTLLAHADALLRQKKWLDSEQLLQKADALLTAGKIRWYRPQWWALRARAALHQTDYRNTLMLGGKGLGAMDDQADLCALPALYRAIAAALEKTHDRAEDARDARLRAVTAAKARGSRLEMARTLFELGWHYKLFANRPTLRARGTGYLYEAETVFRMMGIASPKHVGSAMPLL